MDKEIKREARKQYFHFFRIWFIVLGVLALLCILLGAFRLMRQSDRRGNQPSTDERVFDLADVLTESEENALREYIRTCEERYHFDIVLVTLNENVESVGVWETVMRDVADDFYDEMGYGYNRLHGDGLLLLDNWYIDENGSQKGSWLSTCGKVYEAFGNREIDQVIDAVYRRVDTDPYQAYRDGIEKACRLMAAREASPIGIPWMLTIILPLVVALFYAMTHLHQAPAKDTTTATTYVEGGKPVMREQRDDFIRKSVTSTRIQTSSSSGGGSSHSGRGGGHTSRSGVSHGGGGRRR
ncbi:MAG: TPM domain-containing protein [Candidatus Gastranaerophilales bacterium]|nr:TPM domain-containing protein [Candidatus Gastranaerophilales bacterium]